MFYQVKNQDTLDQMLSSFFIDYTYDELGRIGLDEEGYALLQGSLYDQSSVPTRPDWEWERDVCSFLKKEGKICGLLSKRVFNSKWTVSLDEGYFMQELTLCEALIILNAKGYILE